MAPVLPFLSLHPHITLTKLSHSQHTYSSDFFFRFLLFPQQCRFASTYLRFIGRHFRDGVEGQIGDFSDVSILLSPFTSNSDEGTFQNCKSRSCSDVIHHL